MRRSRRQFLILIFFPVTVWLTGSGCVASNPYSDFPEPQENFESHVSEVRQYLAKTQMQQRSLSDLEFNLPFDKKANTNIPYRGRFLLIHGLNDSPYVFTDVATELTKRGFDVRAILLPGHGNTPEAQLKISYKTWLSAARRQLAFYRSQGQGAIYLGGFSMGAVISTLLAAENDDVAGLFLFSPAYKSTQDHLLKWAGLYSIYKPWVFGGMIREDNPTKYNSIPINGAAQYYNVTKALNRKWRRKQLDVPLLAVASVNDSVVDIEHLKSVFKQQFSSDRKRLILYSETAELDNGAERDASVFFQHSRHMEKRVLNQSHQGVIISANNPLFGEDGAVLVCNGNDWPTFSSCLFYNGQHWYGAQHSPSPDGVPVARTTYNPDFNKVFEEFDKVFVPAN